MAVASFQPAAVVYREEQTFDWWVYALVALTQAGLVAAFVWVYQSGHLPSPGGTFRDLALGLFATSGVCVPLLLVVGLLRMTTEVTPTDVRVWFGWVPTYRRIVPIVDVHRVEVVTFRPIADYGFWGIRAGRDGTRALIARGNRGVRLELADGSVLLIGSQRPETLAQALEGALQPGT